MNDQQFNERAHANPHDDSEEFLAAAASMPERQRLLESLKTLDSKLRSVATPENLKQALLAIPGKETQPESTASSANDALWHRALPYAAVLVIALAVLPYLLREQPNPMEDMIFSHIYSEMNFFDDDIPVSLGEVNAMMDTRVGSRFSETPEMASLNINHTQDCWVDFANGVRGIHFVMDGSMGPVTVIVIPSTPVDAEFAIADDRFDGMISPTAGGNLIVVGEKQEAIRQYTTLLATNIVR